MITGKDIYTVLAAIVPLYVAMFLAYGSVKWWKIFTPAQCSGINRFVAVFAVPLLSFHFISSNNPYAMNYRFIAADSLQKLIILGVLALWVNFGKNGNLEWMITLFSLSTLPNTLVMGIPLLQAMYGEFSGTLMVQIVVLQSVIWYTLMLFMFEYRGGKALIMEQFPETAGSITSFRVESDVVSLDGREPVQADAEIGEDGKLHVVLRKSSTSACTRSANSYKSHGFNSLTSITPRASNLTGVEIYSLQSSREPTPRASSFNHTDFYAMFNGKNNSFMPSPRNGGDVYSVQSSKGPTPRTSNFEEEMTKATRFGRQGGGRSKSGDLVSVGANSYPYPSPNTAVPLSARGGGSSNRKKSPNRKSNEIGNKDLHMFVWSSSASPVSEGNLRHAMNGASSNDYGLQDTSENQSPVRKTGPDGELISQKEHEIDGLCSPNPKFAAVSTCFDQDPLKKPELNENVKDPQMPPASVMTRLILIMVWRKLIRNPNTYSSLIGVVWSLISYRFKIEMPTIVRGSISILSDAGLGMAMFSLGLFMALQPKIIACGKSVALFSMAVRFLTGPAVMAAASIAIGLRGVLLHVAIVQAALPQGIVPFVFAKEYNVHPDILSTAVIFGMLIALPITILYYIILGV